MKTIDDFIDENYQIQLDDIEVIEWDDLESRYIDNCGNTYNVLESIPNHFQSIVQPIKPIKPLKTVSKTKSKF